MNEINWDDLRLFVAVAKAGGLSGATQATGLSAPTLGRRMLALEEALGRDLFVRHAKGYSLTVDGEDVLRQAAGLSGQIEGLSAQRHSRSIKVSAGFWTTRLLCQNSKALVEQQMSLRFIAADHILDIPHREAVIGIRNHRPDHVGLAVQRVAPVSFARYGRPGTPWVHVLSNTPSATWVAENAPPDRIEVSHPTHALDLALAGAAQAVLPTFIAEQEPTLVRRSEDIAELTHDQWIVSHNTDRFIPEVRRTIDRLATLLRRKT